MQCPECGATHIRQNGKRKGKKNYICGPCGRQFIDFRKGILGWVLGDHSAETFAPL